MELRDALEKAINEAEERGKLLFLSDFGSRLYGTATENSDRDIVGLYLPNMLGDYLKGSKKVIRYSSSDDSKKNGAGDFDISIFDIREKLKDFFRGEINAIDVFSAFTNEEAIIYLHPVYEFFFQKFFVDQRVRPARMAGVLGYINQQASKYGIRGTRLGEAIELKDFLDTLDDKKRLEEYDSELRNLVAKMNYISFDEVDKLEKGGEKVRVPALSVFGKLIPLYSTVEQAKEVVQKIVDKYGKRSKLARKNEGVDFKALSHAFRAAYIYKELLSENRGYVLYPLREDFAKFLVEVKSGNINFNELKGQLEKEIEEVVELEKSRTPEFDSSRVYEEMLVYLLTGILKYVDGNWKKILECQFLRGAK